MNARDWLYALVSFAVVYALLTFWFDGALATVAVPFLTLRSDS